MVVWFYTTWVHRTTESPEPKARKQRMAGILWLQWNREQGTNLCRLAAAEEINAQPSKKSSAMKISIKTGVLKTLSFLFIHEMVKTREMNGLIMQTPDLAHFPHSHTAVAGAWFSSELQWWGGAPASPHCHFPEMKWPQWGPVCMTLKLYLVQKLLSFQVHWSPLLSTAVQDPECAHTTYTTLSFCVWDPKLALSVTAFPPPPMTAWDRSEWMLWEENF